MFRYCTSIAIAALLVAGPVLAGDDVPEGTAAQQESTKSTDAEKDRIMKRIIRWSVLAGVPVNTYIISTFTWDWGKTRKFKFADEGFFGQGTYEGGADKIAHMYSHYMFTRLFCNVFDFTENGGSMKYVYAVGLTSFMALGIEVGDGFSRKQNGFSLSDLTMDLSGILVGALLERFPAADAFFGLSVEYWPTRYFRRHPAKLKWFMDDYSGWKFMGNIRLAGFEYLGVKMPVFLRYLQVDLGYFARGYTKYDNRTAYVLRAQRRERDVFIGFSVNFQEIVKDFFSDKNGLACRALQQPFKYYHVPAGPKFSHKL